jgi:hypothetical protein
MLSVNISARVVRDIHIIGDHADRVIISIFKGLTISLCTVTNLRMISGVQKSLGPSESLSHRTYSATNRYSACPYLDAAYLPFSTDTWSKMYTILG